VSYRRDEINMKIRTSEKIAASLLSVVVAGSLLTACGNTQERCDELLGVLAYGPMSDEDDAWYDANCR
jgi:hypothetical protein